MTLFRNKYRIESARLKNWNYANAGAYFITICTKDRLHYFGEIENGEMVLSDIGKIANNFWEEIPNHFKHVKLGASIIMPNHIHGIIILDNTVETLHRNVCEYEINKSETLHCNVSTNDGDSKDVIGDKNESMSKMSPKSGSLSTIIRSYKSACTKSINIQFLEQNFTWQARFHDHIIRDNKEYDFIENYIINNPKNWKNDKFYKS